MKKILLWLLESMEDEKYYKTGTKAPVSGIYRSGKEYIALSKGERLIPSYTDWWVLVVAV